MCYNWCFLPINVHYILTFTLEPNVISWYRLPGNHLAELEAKIQSQIAKALAGDVSIVGDVTQENRNHTMLVPCVITTGSIEDCVCERLAQLAERGIPLRLSIYADLLFFLSLFFFR